MLVFFRFIGVFTLSYSTIIQQNDSGIVLLVTVKDQETNLPKDISSATNILILLKTGNNPKSSLAASFVTDGSDGKVQYTIQDGDLSISGNWLIQVSYMLSGKQRYTSEDVFVVSPNLT